LELKRIEAAKEIVDNLSKSTNVTYLPSMNTSNQQGGVGGGSGPNYLFKI
jgi:hypothetical protein